MSIQYRVEVDIDWLGGLKDRIGRLNIDAMKNWLTLALLAAILALLAWQALRGPVPNPPAPGPPAPGKVEPAPKPEVRPVPDALPPPADTPLSRAMRDYLRQAPTTIPDTLDALADKLDSREIADKLAATVFFKRPASAVNAALDQIFSAGIDQSGKVTDPAKISGPLRDSARALRGAK